MRARGVAQSRASRALQNRFGVGAMAVMLLVLAWVAAEPGLPGREAIQGTGRLLSRPPAVVWPGPAGLTVSEDGGRTCRLLPTPGGDGVAALERCTRWRDRLVWLTDGDTVLASLDGSGQLSEVFLAGRLPRFRRVVDLQPHRHGVLLSLELPAGSAEPAARMVHLPAGTLTPIPDAVGAKGDDDSTVIACLSTDHRHITFRDGPAWRTLPGSLDVPDQLYPGAWDFDAGSRTVAARTGEGVLVGFPGRTRFWPLHVTDASVESVQVTRDGKQVWIATTHTAGGTRSRVLAFRSGGRYLGDVLRVASADVAPPVLPVDDDLERMMPYFER